MSKRLFQVLDEMNLLDEKNNTAHVGVCNSFLGGTDGKNGSRIYIGAPQGTLTQCYSGQKIPILLLIDKKEYEKHSNQ